MTWVERGLIYKRKVKTMPIFRVISDGDGETTLTFTNNCPDDKDADNDDCTVVLEELYDTLIVIWDGRLWQILYDQGGVWTDS